MHAAIYTDTHLHTSHILTHHPITHRPTDAGTDLRILQGEGSGQEFFKGRLQGRNSSRGGFRAGILQGEASGQEFFKGRLQGRNSTRGGFRAGILQGEASGQEFFKEPPKPPVTAVLGVGAERPIFCFRVLATVYSMVGNSCLAIKLTVYDPSIYHKFLVKLSKKVNKVFERTVHCLSHGD